MKKGFMAVRLAIGACLLAASVARGQSSTPSTSGASETGITSEQVTQTPGLVRNPDDTILKAPAAPIAGPVDPKIYIVGPGDLLQFQIWGRASRNWLLPVGPEGYVVLPSAGSLQVAGKTLADVRTEVLKKLQGQFRGVGMDMRLARPRVFKVYVTGQVKATGPVDAMASNRVADILPEAVFQDNASRRRIEVQHTDGTREFCDLVLFSRIGVQSANPWLRDGDVINVPVAVEWVYAQGAVSRAGQIELGLHDSLLTLFRLAGDPIPAAEIDRALLVRWTDPFKPDSVWVRLDEVYDRRTNPALMDGDRLYVYYLPQYHLQHEVFVYGELARPGVYPIAEGRDHLSDLIHSAGGFLPTADLTAIRVHRRAATGSEKDPELERLLRMSREQMTASEYVKLTTKLASLQEDYRVDWTRLNSSPKNLDPLMRDGDLVRVDRLVNSIRVDGEVNRPGILAFVPGSSVSDYIQQAGGFTERAWKPRVRVTRAVTGQTLPAKDVKSLDPGDFVWVPEEPDHSFYDFFRDTLTSLALIATVVLAIQSVK